MDANLNIFCIEISELPNTQVMDSLENAAERFGCTLHWTDEGLEVQTPAPDLLFDCFLMTLAQALPPISPHWSLKVESIAMAA